jgi:hypothetical protein
MMPARTNSLEGIDFDLVATKIKDDACKNEKTDLEGIDFDLVATKIKDDACKNEKTDLWCHYGRWRWWRKSERSRTSIYLLA